MDGDDSEEVCVSLCVTVQRDLHTKVKCFCGTLMQSWWVFGICQENSVSSEAVAYIDEILLPTVTTADCVIGYQ